MKKINLDEEAPCDKCYEKYRYIHFTFITDHFEDLTEYEKSTNRY